MSDLTGCIYHIPGKHKKGGACSLGGDDDYEIVWLGGKTMKIMGVLLYQGKRQW